MKPDAREPLVGNIVASMKSVPRRIQELQIQHFWKAGPAYGTSVAEGLGLNGEEITPFRLANPLRLTEGYE